MIISGDDRSLSGPSEELSIGVTFPTRSGDPGPVAARRLGRELSLDEKCPTKENIKNAERVLKRHGFTVSGRGKASLSVRATRRVFESTFKTELSTMSIGQPPGTMVSAERFYYPGGDAPWEQHSELTRFIDDAYIQWPHIYLNQRFARDKPSPLSNHLSLSYHHLDVSEISVLLNAERVHRNGITGRGVRVVMIDSGFAQVHPYFQERGYRVRTVLAGKATHKNLDGNGHGTGESANLLGVAPDIEFVGVKLDNENDPSGGATLLEGFQEAIQHAPNVISISLGSDLRNQYTGGPLVALPNNLVALETEIQAAVASGITVVFAAGNRHISFPGMMPDVISAGGVFVDSRGRMEASDYASAFDSQIYKGRHVPDCSGLVGRAYNGAAYLLLPIPEGCEIDVSRAMADGTQPNDGWGVFSGTSAAAPQLAGACALLLESNPDLTPKDIRHALMRSVRRVRYGHANPASNPGRAPLRGQKATGGLVDIHAALQLVGSGTSAKGSQVAAPTP